MENSPDYRTVVSFFIESATTPPPMTVSQWADEYRVLPREAAAEAGRWRTSRTPYLREPMDAFDDRDVETIVLIFASQTGKSESIFNAIGKMVHLDPCPMMMIQPTVDMAEAVSKDRIATMFRDTKVLAESYAENESTILYKKFAGGHLTMVGANAPAGLASRPIRIVLADEVDRYPPSAGDEGDPVSLAIRRTATFPTTRKVVMTSTPTVEGTSRIEKAFKQTDQRYFFVPCQHCGHHQALTWEHVQFEEENPDDAAIACEECGVLWSEADRIKSVSAGEWRATGTPRQKSWRGYHLNGLYSPWYTVAGIVRNYLEAKGDPAQYRTFVNTVLSLPYRDELDAIEESELERRREQFDDTRIPAGCLLLTQGIDIQQDRAEITVLGFGESQDYIISHTVIPGDPTGSALWERVIEHTERTYKHELGGEISIDASAVDSGNWTQEVYAFCLANRHRNFYAVKGVPGPRPTWVKSKQRLKGGGQLHLVGVDTAKSDLFHRLKIREPDRPSYLHLSHTLTRAYFEQLLSEYRELTFNKGVPVYTWLRKPNKRAEALDCAVYGRAVRSMLSPNWKTRREKLTVRPGKERPAPRSLGDLAKKLS